MLDENNKNSPEKDKKERNEQNDLDIDHTHKAKTRRSKLLLQYMLEQQSFKGRNKVLANDVWQETRPLLLQKYIGSSHSAEKGEIYLHLKLLKKHLALFKPLDFDALV